MSAETPAASGQFTRRRQQFRAWRGTRPFWAGLFVLLAGFPIAYFPYAHLQVGHLTLAMATTAGAGSLIIGVLLGVLGISLWFQKHVQVFAGVAAILLALVSIPVSNLGGFLVGFLFALVGGAMAISWAPGRAEERDTPHRGALRGAEPLGGAVVHRPPAILSFLGSSPRGVDQNTATAHEHGQCQGREAQCGMTVRRRRPRRPRPRSSERATGPRHAARRHAAPRKSLLTKFQMPAGKAMIFAAMPTAVFVGMGSPVARAGGRQHQQGRQPVREPGPTSPARRTRRRRRLPRPRSRTRPRARVRARTPGTARVTTVRSRAAVPPGAEAVLDAFGATPSGTHTPDPTQSSASRVRAAAAKKRAAAACSAGSAPWWAACWAGTTSPRPTPTPSDTPTPSSTPSAASTSDVGYHREAGFPRRTRPRRATPSSRLGPGRYLEG